MSSNIPAYPVSVLFSAAGPYAGLGREAVAGALAGIAEINASPTLSLRLRPVIADPRGEDRRYAELAEGAIRDGSRHVVGALTSSARKEIVPVVERHDALLWYAFPYEGYESSQHALYFGACPNQHLLPLFDYLLPRQGVRPFVVGSNYIWGWEIARIARELVEARGGALSADRYLPLGHIDCDHLIAEIRQKKPDFILSNLVGESLHAFIRAYHSLGLEDDAFRPENCPVVSCNMTDFDLSAVGAAAAGHITVSTYLHELDTADNRAFKARMTERLGEGHAISSCFAAAYSAVLVLGTAMAEAGSDDPAAVREIVTARRFATPLGDLRVDPRNHHADLTPHLARAGADGCFHVLEQSSGPVAADPYLAGLAARAALTPHPADLPIEASQARKLRVVK
ncbi:transporter substrate-binding protein [Jiella mangrovi]|uniref:Transporter substrate-binding protein n=1 Tax=Jiella mangrovi TaxID=2821407 RepID=A0ABS4BJB9_9HYPH|nr:transporter substrate-binding protein [Jiella mangrovi]MBP0616863.1 transporter substrate-binding protein [Jiella mangrovi]